jgi:hypothetical protein
MAITDNTITYSINTDYNTAHKYIYDTFSTGTTTTSISWDPKFYSTGTYFSPRNQSFFKQVAKRL